MMFLKSGSHRVSAKTKLQAALEGLRVHDHLCLIYETCEEQFAAVIPFIRIGLERGEKCVYIADENTAETVFTAMREKGIDADAALKKGALSVISKKEAYLREGYFDPDMMISFLREAIDSVEKDGFAALRATGEMTWALGSEIGVERLLEYEAKLNYFIPENRIIAICQYNRRRFSSEVIRDIIRTHPLVIHGDMVCRNHYFVPPDEFLAADSVSREVERLLFNIREREETLEALRESEMLYRSVVTAMSDGVVVQDANGAITSVNPAAERIEGRSADQMIGLTSDDPCWQAVYEDGRPFPADLHPSMVTLRTGEPQSNVVMGVQRPDGTLVWISINSQPLISSGESLPYAVVTTFHDITGRKMAEEKLKMALAYNRSLIEASLDPLVTINADGTITDVNGATEKVTGYPRAELIGKDFSDYFTEAEKARAGYQQAFREGSVHDHELEIKHQNGHLTPVRYNASVYRNEAGDVIGVFAAARDISERKKLEEQLRQSQKMEAVGLLAGGIAHDFNNVLQSIIGYGNLILMKLGEDDPLRTDVDQVLAAAVKAAGLTQSLLAFSRKQVMNLKPVNVNEIISNMEKFLARVIGEEIRIQTEFREDLLGVNVDSGQIEQVLMNLATNARDAMSRGGILSIVTESIEMDEAFIKTHGFGVPGRYALVTISDSGTGMDAATVKRIFEPFFTTKKMGRGTGLGLAIVYGIVMQHNGYITVASEPDRGTTFRIFLPLLENAQADKASEKTLQRPSRGTETVLVAEDDYHTRALLSAILTEFGYTVIEATDGEDALEKYLGNRDRIQLLLFDMIMPKKRGNEVYNEIRKMGGTVKAVFLSGYPSDIVHGNLVLEEGLDLIMKPVSPQKLLKKIREVLEDERSAVAD